MPADFFFVRRFSFFFLFCRSVWEFFSFCRLFQFCCFRVFFFCQTFWSSLSFFVGMLTFGDLDDCRYYMKGVLFPIKLDVLMFLFFVFFLGCLTPNEPELIDNFGCNRWF
ncbi:hypothetical protein GLOIN_2v1092401 [Rhizophagus irregularis DAOM 181602=DAOM 197198]|uniref:Uncharacterized protein n=1 Tax=Rhizophagus irregularis (strain DAOM 181602 / DAOM 197198 / MUCL 43194) TaxID=747089 RepID=A0A2P4Q7L9_RHIID|nr:hypothetical protein GLOIN_2v1092401 [Rhizophagus irregularis DAOM 181602=DAOM 197198]POG73619.1 hypothetical protein GLOIN_2v1092401 [Rhizophagus irregularis DAOM 181602=DAOM 197198]|eukprot:XP_025180485.1 hypothetical protein GLOIN_2v1092401 [Rhizophagus irregularis DAOM 181602=DAOM 197198]